ncbi:MAG TPA: flagellar basal body-associated FliL family protein [Pseudobdellovibrionaceae bacterium]|nr:flagellar basal body-associated FliL family protein [Pseudobdellovibrionaceae bacterium]
MANDKEEKKSSGSGLSKIFPILFGVINLSVTGAGAFLVYKGTIGWTRPVLTDAMLEKERVQVLEEVAKEPLLYTLDKFTVNLDGEPKRTIRMEVNLEMAQVEGIEEIMNSDNRVRARDRIIGILHEKSFSDLETLQGKLFLKDLIASEMNHILSRNYVKEVYFSEFIVQ